jgi:hypothetical protein
VSVVSKTYSTDVRRTAVSAFDGLRFELIIVFIATSLLGHGRKQGRVDMRALPIFVPGVAGFAITYPSPLLELHHQPAFAIFPSNSEQAWIEAPDKAFPEELVAQPVQIVREAIGMCFLGRHITWASHGFQLAQGSTLMGLTAETKIVKNPKAHTMYITIPAVLAQDSAYPFKDVTDVEIEIVPKEGVLVVRPRPRSAPATKRK